MSEDVTRRIERLEEHLQRLEQKVGVIEARYWGFQPTAQSAGPPPPIIAEPSYVRPDLPENGTDRKGDGAEYLIGARLLPRVGGLLVLLSIVFLVAWGFSKGWITKEMVFAGEVLLSLAFVALGQATANLREHYGQILTGVGLGGLYVTLVGGYTEYGLYDGATTVVLTTALSLSMVLASGIRLWAGLWTLGVLGGLYASTLPLSKGDLRVSLALHFLVLISSGLISLRFKNRGYVVALWLGSLCALAPMVGGRYDGDTVLAAFLSAGLFCMGAYVFGEAADAVFPALVGSLLSMAAVQHGRPAFVIAFCAGVALVGVLPSRSQWRFQLALGVILACLTAPWCYDDLPRSQALLSLGGLFGLASFVRFRRSALTASMLLLMDGTASVAAAWPRPEILSWCWSSLLALSVLILAAGISLWHRKGVPAVFSFGMLLICWVFWSGLVDHEVTGNPFAMSISWGVLAAIELLVGFAIKERAFRFTSFGLLGLTVGKVMLNDLAFLDPGLRVAILMVLGLIMLAVGYGYVRIRPTMRISS